MELLIALVVLVFFGFPIWVLVKMASHSGRIDELKNEIGVLDYRVRSLKNEVEQLRSHPQDMAAAPEPTRTTEEAPQPLAPVVPPPVAEVFATTATVPLEPAAAPPLPPKIEAPPFVPPLVSEPVRKTPEMPKMPAINWEQFMGVKLFAWIGGFALFIGVALFLKYSFEHNLIPPALRVAMGFLVGIGLVVGGVVMSRKEYAVTSQTLCGTGVVILYAVTFACHAVYHFPFFGQIPTFLLMVLITATAFLLAVRLEALVVAVLGMLGGFLTPVLLSTGQDNPLGLFGYIGLLDIGLIAVALNRRWNFLALLGAIGTVGMQIGWVEKFFEVPKVFTGMGIFLSFSALFVISHFFAQKRKQNDKWFAAPAIVMPFVALLFGFYLLKYAELGQRPGLIFSFAVLVDLCLIALAFLDRKLVQVHLASGIAVFVMLSVWTMQYLSNTLLNWALGLYLLFAILHSVLPILLNRIQPLGKQSWWAHLFPPVALLLVIIPITRIPEVSFFVWPCILLIDLLAIGLAVLTASLLSIVAVLLLTLVATGLWIMRIPADLTGMPESLFLIGGFAVFFFGVAIFATRKIWAKLSQKTATPTDELFGFELTPATLAQLPAMSSILPFLLLIMVAVRLPLLNPSPVFGLALLLVVMLLGVARKFAMEWLPAIGLGCVLALEHAWHFEHFTPAYVGLSLGWYIGFYFVFGLFPFLFRKDFAQKTIPWAVAALAGPAQFYLVHRLVAEAFPNNMMGILPAVFALPPVAGLVFLLRQPKTDSARTSQLAWFGGVALFFITLIFPIQFERQWITIGWALEGAALLWLFHRVPHNGLRVTGIGLLMIAFVRLALNPAVLSYHARSATPIFNWYLYAYTVVTVCLFVGAKLLARPCNIVFGNNIPPILYSLGTILAFLLVNIEIADFFSKPNEMVSFSFGGNLAREMTYTIAWALFAFVVLIVGIAKKLRAARYAAMGLLAITVLKLFLHDLAHLAQLYRIGALISVAIIAILASFFYQKFFSSSTQSEATPSNESPSAP